MTTNHRERRAPQGGLLRLCSTCGRDNDNWTVTPDGTGLAEYRCPEQGCIGAFTAELRVVSRRSEATGGPEFRQ